MRRALLLLVVAAVSATARASADPAVPASSAAAWTIEVDPGCPPGEGRARFVREVELACDALGTPCLVDPGTSSPTGASGPRRARLACDGEGKLEVSDNGGALLWTIPLGDGGMDRLRRAALWIARAPLDAPPPPARESDTKPEPTSLPASEGTAFPIAVADPTRDAGASSARTPTPARPGPSGVLVAERTLLLGSGFGPLVGGRAAAALALVAPHLAVAAAISGGRTVSGPSGYDYAEGRVGAGVAWGAPWSGAPFGLSLEGGATLASVSAPSGVSPSSEAFGRAYAEAAFSAQWNGSRAFRPFATLGASIQSGHRAVLNTGVTEASISWLSASLDLGVAWRSW